jgi:hypothetical protein
MYCEPPISMIGGEKGRGEHALGDKSKRNSKNLVQFSISSLHRPGEDARTSRHDARLDACSIPAMPAPKRSTAVQRKPAACANGRHKIENKSCIYVSTWSRAKQAAPEEVAQFVPALERSTAVRRKPAVSANGRQKIENKSCIYVSTQSRAKRVAPEEVAQFVPAIERSTTA